MPHTSRRKHPKGPQKRIQVTDANGWTTVTKGVRQQNNRQPVVSDGSTRVEPLLPSTIPPGLTYQEVKENFQRYLRIWKASSCFIALKEVLKQSVLTSRAVKLERCVCLGLGSLTGGGTVDASCWELAALVSILEILCPFVSCHSDSMTDGRSQRPNSPSKMYACKTQSSTG